MGQLLFYCPGSAGDFDIKILTPGRFSIVKGRAKSMVLTTSCLSPGVGSIAGH